MRAYVISMLWGWFIAPPFHLPDISLSTAFGFSLIVRTFTQYIPGSSEKGKVKNWGELVGMMCGQLIGYVVALGPGWLIHVPASA